MKKKLWPVVLIVSAACVFGMTGCSRFGLGGLLAGRNREAAGQEAPEEQPQSDMTAQSGAPGKGTGTTAPAGNAAGGVTAGTREEAVWPGIYVYGEPDSGEIFAVTGADGQTVTGWYLYETAAGSYGMREFSWEIDDADPNTATEPFGNGSDQIDTYQLQADRITVSYPDGWWEDRDYMYLCAVGDAGTYVTHPSFDFSLLGGGAAPAGNPGAPAGDAGTAAVSQPFYGVWVLGSQELSDCRDMVDQLLSQGYSDAAVFLTTDWSNLNTEPWYVVTAGVYATEDAANAALPGVQAAGYADAYVKYSGERQAFAFE